MFKYYFVYEKSHATPRHATPRHAFSLVELSIVLVILGLLVGGVLSGQSLIRAAELRSISSDFQRYSAAALSFRDKYFAIPGDMNNATRFWGRLNSNADCVTNSAAAVAAPGACDGDGNGTLNGPAAANSSTEWHQFWRHLALAGLVEGSYSGVYGPAAAEDTIIGTTVPRGKISNTGWLAWSAPNYIGDGSAWAVNYQSVLEIGAAVANKLPLAQNLRPEEAWNIDTKMDDGLPGRGKVLGRYWNNLCSQATDGTPAANDFNATYRLTDSALQCTLQFVNFM